MSYVKHHQYDKRQEMFSNVNPLLKKYKYDGEHPPTYVPMDKRKSISHYMGRSSFAPGYYEPKADKAEGNKTMKMTSEGKNQQKADYQQSLDDRIREGDAVKQFMNKERIQYGRNIDKADIRYRQRSQKSVQPKESYGMMVKQREGIKKNTNKINCFVDENQPEFINTMTRTMDAYDTRMSTFGGKQKLDKDKYHDKFIAEKRGFIRTSNAYQSANPERIVEAEVVDPQRLERQRPGPAFKQSYDNKYQKSSSYAHEKGRVKIPLEISKQSMRALREAAPAEGMYELKKSNIKFDQDEMGTKLMNEREAQEAHSRQQAYQYGTAANEYAGAVDPSQLQDGSVFANQGGNAQNDFGTGSAGGPRAKTSQKSRERPSKIKSKGDAGVPVGREVSFDNTPLDESAFQSSAYKSSGSKWNRPNAESGLGPKPYELWKQNMVIHPDTVVLGQHKNIIHNFDQSSKAHLTSVKGAPNINDYKSIGRVYHGQAQSVDRSHIELDLGVHKVMKTTTYSIGKKGFDAPNEKMSSNQQVFTTKVHPDEEPPLVDKNSRRCDPTNPNRIMTVGFGHGAESGTKDEQQAHRANTYYNHYFQPKRPDIAANEAHEINKQRNDYNLSNKFQYGLDNEGGAVAGKKPDDPTQIKDCLKGSAVNHNQREEYKEKIERQNFTIQPAKQLENTVTKYIGTHGGKGISNVIDIDDLKRSHIPITGEAGSQSDPMSMYRSFQEKSQVGQAYGGRSGAAVAGIRTAKNEYCAFKYGSEVSKVPFSPEKRNRVERTYQKFDKPNGYGASSNKASFGWKVPTYDLNP